MGFKTLSSRVTLNIAIVVVALVTVLFIAYVLKTRTTLLQEEITTARTTILMAESVREGMEQKWKLGLFTPEDLRQIVATSPTREAAKEKLLAAVPVVSAWEAAKAKSEELGLTFRTPRQNARNPDNTPDAVESDALAYFEKNPQAREYHVIDNAMNAIRYFRPVRLSEACLVCHGDPAQSRSVWGRDDGKDITGYAMDNKKVGDLHGAFEVIRPLDKMDAYLLHNVELGLAIVALITLPLLILMWLITRKQVGEPITEIASKLRFLADGELTVTCTRDERKDEIGDLSRGLNHLSREMRKLVQQISTTSHELERSAEDMTGSVQTSREALSRQNLEIDMVATAMNEMAASVNEVAHHASDAANAASEADESARLAARDIEALIRELDKLATDMEQASSNVDRLKADSYDIGRVVDVIRGIAEQTNLLALNAAIEAARAGEQGRGFAVVAEEVRSLASKTQASTQEIQAMIERLQGSAENTARGITERRIKTRKDAEQAQIAGEAIHRILEGVSRINDMNAQIATAANQQSSVSEEINRNLHNVQGQIEQTTTSADRLDGAAGKLARLATTLTEQIRQFRT